jgi:hypothetical protein
LPPALQAADVLNILAESGIYDRRKALILKPVDIQIGKYMYIKFKIYI